MAWSCMSIKQNVMDRLSAKIEPLENLLSCALLYCTVLYYVFRIHTVTSSLSMASSSTIVIVSWSIFTETSIRQSNSCTILLYMYVYVCTSYAAPYRRCSNIVCFSLIMCKLLHKFLQHAHAPRNVTVHVRNYSVQ